jgi:hypothetical protein
VQAQREVLLGLGNEAQCGMRSGRLLKLRGMRVLKMMFNAEMAEMMVM